MVLLHNRTQATKTAEVKQATNEICMATFHSLPACRHNATTAVVSKAKEDDNGHSDGKGHRDGGAVDRDGHLLQRRHHREGTREVKNDGVGYKYR